MAQVGEYLKEYQDMLQSELRNTHPELLKGCDRILEFLASAQGDRQMPDSSNSPHEESEVASNNETTDGTQEKSLASKRATEQYTSTQRMSPTTDSELETRHLIQSNMMIKLDQSVSDTIDRFMGGSTNYSYSFLEASFARRLKRFSLEHAFRVFTNPQSNPYEVFRLFRLVPCFRERDKMHPYFKDLVTSDRGHSLEISALPFYTIGGAGTHYPDLNGHGDPIYPPNMRVPRRILGIIPGMNGEDNSIHLDQPQQSQLQLCGFGGEWFDCRDVEGFLREKGVQITESSVFPSVKEVQNGK
ncbi:unnamed protein product [Penicillium olsonii]|nr:unnamed protein product [Penicillium olsonii]